VITLCGLGFVVINLLMVFYYIPDFIGPGPPWIYYR
jgi:ethanolaminephosphotransferase